MNNSSRKKQFGMNIGSASILLVFVILCLVSFAVLSIVSANADSKLSARVLERTTAYYAACNQAEQSLAGMDKTLQRMYASSDSEEAYFVAVGHGKSYVIPISDLQTLQVTIEILYPESDEDTFYRITAWQVLNTDQRLFPLPQFLLLCSHLHSVLHLLHPVRFRRSGSVLHRHRTYHHGNQWSLQHRCSVWYCDISSYRFLQESAYR